MGTIIFGDRESMLATQKQNPELYNKLQYSQGIILINPDKSVTVSKLEKRDDGGLNQRIDTYSDMRTMSIAKSYTKPDEKPPWKPCPGQTTFPKNPYDPNLNRPRPCPSLSSCDSLQRWASYKPKTTSSCTSCKPAIPKDYQGYMTSILNNLSGNAPASQPTTRKWKYNPETGGFIEYRRQKTSRGKKYKTKKIAEKNKLKFDIRRLVF